MKILLSLFAIILVQFSFAQDWQTTETFMPGQTLKDIFVADSNNIYAVSALYDGSAMNIKKSTNDGETWSEQYSGYTSQNYYEIASPDSVDIFIVGNAGVLIHNDGGDEWTTVSTGTEENLRSIFFVNKTIGYIGGDAGTVLKTTNGGDTWTNLEAILDAPYSILDLHMLSESHGFVIGHGFIQVTNDGGLNWTFVPGFSPSDGLYGFREMQFVNNNLGYVCGDHGDMYKSVDGGLTWEIQVTGTEESIQDVRFLDEFIGFACGFAGVALRTLDGGENWTILSADLEENFYTLDFHLNKGFMGSYYGSILIFEGGPLSIQEAENTPIALYPNPVINSAITLNWQGHQQFNYVIYDISGNLVLNGNQILNNSTINISNLSAATYFLVLSDGQIEQAQKLIVR